MAKKKGIEKYCKSNQAIGCNEFTVDENVISENCNYLSHIVYNVWKKGMDSRGINYIKGNLLNCLSFYGSYFSKNSDLFMTCFGFH